MKNHLFSISTLSVLLALTLSASLRAADPEAASRAADDARVAAMTSADPAKIAATFSDDLLYVHSSGSSDTKASMTAALTSGKSKYNTITYEERKFREVSPGLVLMTGLVSVACGDDDNPKGPGDASTDGAVEAGGGNFIPRRDASVTPPTDPIAECDRFDPNSCPAGLVCDTLVRLFAGDDQLSIYAGCVTASPRERESAQV